MSPMSDAIERIAARHGVPAPEALEYFLERREFHQGDETAAIADLENLWIKLWIAVKGEPGPQMRLRAK